MPVVYPNYGPGAGTGALDALRSLMSASPQHGLHPEDHALTEHGDNWGPEPGTPPSEVPIALQMLQSFKSGRPSIMTKLRGPAALQSSDQESRPENIR